MERLVLILVKAAIHAHANLVLLGQAVKLKSMNAPKAPAEMVEAVL